MRSLFLLLLLTPHLAAALTMEGCDVSKETLPSDSDVPKAGAKDDAIPEMTKSELERWRADRLWNKLAEKCRPVVTENSRSIFYHYDQSQKGDTHRLYGLCVREKSQKKEDFLFCKYLGWTDLD